MAETVCAGRTNYWSNHFTSRIRDLGLRFIITRTSFDCSTACLPYFIIKSRFSRIVCFACFWWVHIFPPMNLLWELLVLRRKTVPDCFNQSALGTLDLLFLQLYFPSTLLIFLLHFKCSKQKEYESEIFYILRRHFNTRFIPKDINWIRNGEISFGTVIRILEIFLMRYWYYMCFVYGCFIFVLTASGDTSYPFLNTIFLYT